MWYKRHTINIFSNGRLVAKGFSQKPTFDFQATFSPVVKSASLRIVLALALTHKWCLRQIDIINAFIQGEHTEEVYMVQSPDFKDTHYDGSTHVSKHQHALYGLKSCLV